MEFLTKLKNKSLGGNKPWCQTEKQPPEMKIPIEDGTHDWGWCNPQKMDTGEQTIRLYAGTSNKQGNMAGKDSLKLTMMGDVNVSNQFTVSDHGFTRGDSQIMTTNQVLVGDIVMLTIKTTNSEANPFVCTKFVISQGYKQWLVPCSGPLFKKDKNRAIVFNTTGNVGYKADLTVAVGCSDPIWIDIQGSEGTTVRQVLSDQGQREGNHISDLIGHFVGDIQKVAFWKMPGCDLQLTKFKILYASGTGEVEWEKEISISTQTFIEVPKPMPPQAPGKGKGPGGGSSMAPPPEPSKLDMRKIALKGVDPDYAATLFDGSCMPPPQMKKIVDIGCSDTFESRIDEFSNQSKELRKTMFPAVDVLQGRCPDDCNQTDLEVIGATIHPLKQAICPAAFLDRAIDHSGGVIQLFMTMAQKSQSHHFWGTANRLHLAPAGGEDSNVSFVVAKVDTPGMTSKKIRIVKNGRLDSEGRLEIMIDRIWKSVGEFMNPKESETTEGIMTNVAAAACKQLGYKYGLIKTQGSELSEFIPQTQLNCEIVNDTFDTCEQNGQENAVDHSVDAIVQCLKIDPTSGVKPKGFTELYSPQAGAPLAQPMFHWTKGEKQLLCASVFQDPPADKDNPKKGQLKGQEIGDQFCRLKGSAKMAKNGGISIDTAYPKTNKDFKFAEKIAKIDFEKMVVKSMTAASEDCKPVKIMCEGKANQVLIKANPRDQGRMPGPSVERIACSDTPKSLMLKGMPGSVYTFECPAGCDKAGTLTGTGLQSFSSPICMAAIQQGQLSATDSDLVSLVLGYPKFLYNGGVNNDGIRSQNFPMEEQYDISTLPVTFSYAIIQCNTCYQQDVWPMPERYFLQSNAHTFRRPINNYQSPAGLSFMQTQTSMRGAMSRQFNQQFEGSNPVFFYTPLDMELKPVNMKEGVDESIDLGTELGHEFTQELEDQFSIAVGVNFEKIPKSKDQIVVFAHSSNSCYSLVVKDLRNPNVAPQFAFRKTGYPGAINSFSTSYSPKEGTNQHLVFTYARGLMKWQLNGEFKGQQDGKNFEGFNPSTCNSTLRLGNDDGGHGMSGQVYYFLMFKNILPADAIEHFQGTLNTTVLLPKKVFSMGMMTKDNRVCATNCHFTKPPPSEEAPARKPLIDPAEKAEAEQEAKAAKGTQSDKGRSEMPKMEKLEKKAGDEGIDETALKEPAATGSDFQMCMLRAEDVYKKEDNIAETEPGQFHISGQRVECPADCTKVTDSKWQVQGPEESIDERSAFIQSLNSSICAASVHMGVISGEEGGTVLVHLAKSRGPFITVAQNGITSLAADKGTGAVYISQSPPPHLFTCDMAPVSSSLSLEDGKTYNVECPPGCYSSVKESEAQNVFGNPHTGQTWDSSLCNAAIHAGFLSDVKTAVFAVKVIKEKKEYPCSLSEWDSCLVNGINSLSKKQKASFVFEDAAKACAYQRDVPTIPIIKRQQVAHNPKEHWDFSGDKILPRNADKEKSLIINKRFDCGSAKINFNLTVLNKDNKPFSDELNDQFGIAFRYLKIEGMEEQQLLKIMKDGAELSIQRAEANDMIQKADYPFGVTEDMDSYQFQLVYNHFMIELTMYKEPSYTQVWLFNIVHDSIHRGSVGLEKVGNLNLSLDFFEVVDPATKPKQTPLSVDVERVRFANMESACMTLKMIGDSLGFQKCLHPWGQCRRHCLQLKNQPISKTECVNKCMKKQDMWVHMMSKKTVGTTPCNEVSEGLEYQSMMKVDQKPLLNCQGKPNQSEQVSAQLIKADVKGELCEFTVKQPCQKVGGEEGVLELLEAKDSDKTRFMPCGNELEARKTVPVEGKPLCEQKISEVNGFETNQKWLRMV